MVGMALDAAGAELDPVLLECHQVMLDGAEVVMGLQPLPGVQWWKGSKGTWRRKRGLGGLGYTGYQGCTGCTVQG